MALLHLFKRRETATFRWCVLMMWLFAVFGMSVFGLDGVLLEANNLHVLFIPLMTFYGLAYVLVLWTRLEINVKLVRYAFIAFLFLISALPFLVTFVSLVGSPKAQVQWPPYVPPYIAILGTWTTEKEMIMTDMPWAVAWYADRLSLWLPTTVKDYTELNDYDKLKGRIVGLYLTPVSGNLPFLQEVVNGEYKEWQPFITRNVNLKNFPLHAATPLPIDRGCIFYADRDRWTARED